jgi:hypothetical protein
MRYIKNSVTRALLCGGLLTSLLQVTPTSSYTVPRFPQSTVLSGEDIEEAIMRGRNGDVAPYLINGLGGGSRPKAVIYTPFVRVALAAKAGVLTFDGSTILSQVAPQWIASPEVLVVFSRPCPGEPACERGGVVVDPIAESPTRLYIDQRVTQRPSPVPPAVATPIRMLALRDLQWLGTIPVEGPTVAATFSPQEFMAGARVAAEWGRWNTVVFIVGGYIKEAHLETWR